MGRRSLALLLLVLALVSGATLARADDEPIFDIAPGSAEVGAQLGIGTITGGICPCLRWVANFRLLNGKWESREILISSDALIQFQNALALTGGRTASQTVTLAQVEALMKNARIGLGFEGFTVGEDLDRGRTDILRTGLYFIANLIRSKAIRFDVDGGYEFEQFRFNSSDLVERHHIIPSFVFHWIPGPRGAPRVSGDIRALIDINPAERISVETTRLKVDAKFRAQLIRSNAVSWGIGFNASYERDPYLALNYGFANDLAMLGVFVDLRFLGKKK